MSDTTDTRTDGTDTGDDDASSGDDTTQGDGDQRLSLTQAQLDALIDARLARDRRRRDRDSKDRESKPDPRQDAKKDDDGDDVRALREELAQLRAERERDLMTSKATTIAAEIGAKSDRAASVVRLADLDGLTAADAEDIREAIEAVLDEYPEWRKGDDDDQPARRRARRSTRDDTNDRPAATQTRASKADPGLPRLIAAYEESSKAG